MTVSGAAEFARSIVSAGGEATVITVDMREADLPQMANQYAHDSEVKDDGQDLNPGAVAEVEFRATRQDGLISYWYVEVFCNEGKQFPVGTAYIKSIDEMGFAQLDFVLVADQYRRQGVGTRLCGAIRERWPNAVSTGPIDAQGDGLLRAIDLRANTEEG